MKVSIIVPVYNMKKYINRCINSILNQDFKDFELILIDDGSTDGSEQICDEYSKNDSRIRVFHKENGGVSSARNFGIDRANGDYISFIDSDDYICNNMISNMYDEAINKKAEIVVCNFEYEVSVAEGKVYRRRYSNTNKDRMFSNFEGMKSLLLKEFDNGPCNKIYARRLFESIRFPEGLLFEDLYTVYKLFYKASTVFFIHTPLYIYFQRKNSFMLQKFNIHKLDRIGASEERFNFIRKNYPQLNDIAYASCIEEKMAAVNDCIRSNADIGIVESAVKALQNEYKDVINNKYIDLKRKIMSIILKVNFNLYRFIIVKLT